MMNIAMSSSEIRSSEGVVNTHLGGGRKIMQLGEGRMNTQLGEWTEMPQEEKGLSDVEWITKEKGTEMSKMMLEAIWYRIEWIVLGCIGKTKSSIRWLQAPYVSVRESGQPQFLLTSE